MWDVLKSPPSKKEPEQEESYEQYLLNLAADALRKNNMPAYQTIMEQLMRLYRGPN